MFAELLDALKTKHACVGDVRHIGLFGAVELVKNKETKEPIVPYGRDPEMVMAKIHGLLKERGFASFGRENNINVIPPLIITEKELREAIRILDEVLTIVDTKFI